MDRSLVDPTPWDAAALGTATFELRECSREALVQMQRAPGHYTVRVNPVASKKMLHECGFYYCDTLLEPHCDAAQFLGRRNDLAAVTCDATLESVLAICHGAFTHGRFHRDFNVAPACADLRYDRWLAQLHGEGRVRGLVFGDELAGFAAAVNGRLVLHALSPRFAGRGLAGYLWSALCENLFDTGTGEITSSISASNVAAINLYAGLGFRFRKPVDVYHCVIP